MKADGDCFEVAVELMTYVLSREDAILVHAVVTGRGPLEGRKFSHAWVGAGGLAVDISNGLSTALQAAIYRLLSRHHQLVEYTYHEMAENISVHGTYGPWDPSILNRKR